jgi:hypothetical protein
LFLETNALTSSWYKEASVFDLPLPVFPKIAM